MAPVKTFLDVIDAWPTVEAMAKDIGVSSVKIRQWKLRNSIPGGHWRRVVEAAGRRGYRAITYALLAKLADMGTSRPTSRRAARKSPVKSSSHGTQIPRKTTRSATARST